MAVLAGPAGFSGASALEFTRRVVALGPRPVGSSAHARTGEMIRSHLQRHGWELIDDTFTAQTPHGPKQMRNLIGRLRGTSGRAVVISGHYDTKIIEGIRFVGANDAGSSTGLLMELARVLAGARRRDDIYLVWFDGEEAFGQWTESDSLYGSRHLAERWEREGVLGRIKALINVDMIGDRDLRLVEEQSGSASLRQLVWSVAHELGYKRQFPHAPGYIGDDHMPFVERRVPAIDLIDFEYGPNNGFWHTEDDTMDKLSADSFQAVGDVLVAVLKKLEAG